MDFSKFERLPQVKIDKPCPENWDAMEGDEQLRHCEGCGCQVHNVAEMWAAEAEELLSSPERVCARLTVDDSQSVLTRDGWIPRLVLAGAIAATVAGCAPTHSSAAVTSTSSTAPSQFELLEDKLVEMCDDIVDAVLPNLRPKVTVFMGDIAISPTSHPLTPLPPAKP